MRRGSTPTHVFNVSVDPSVIGKVRILYAQGGKLVLKKEHADCVIDGQKILVKLTQEDTLAFKDGTAEIQIRINTPDGNSVSSDICLVDVDRLLENEVFA